MIVAQGLHHVAVQVRDVERVAAFYRDALGLPEVARFLFEDGRLRSVWLAARAGGDGDLSGGFIAVERAADARPPGTLGFSMVALRIDPAAREATEAALAAKEIPVEKRTDWTLYVRDPEGNLVGLSHHPHPAGRVL
jgi:catechol 2,3-dioxygenase-like lactoylglutathione lyase family enzyme